MTNAPRNATSETHRLVLHLEPMSLFCSVPKIEVLQVPRVMEELQYVAISI